MRGSIRSMLAHADAPECLWACAARALGQARGDRQREEHQSGRARSETTGRAACDPMLSRARGGTGVPVALGVECAIRSQVGAWCYQV